MPQLRRKEFFSWVLGLKKLKLILIKLKSLREKRKHFFTGNIIQPIN